MNNTNTIQEQVASAEAVALIKGWLKTNRGKSRTALAQYVCEAYGLKDARGRMRTGGVLKSLRVLEERDYWKLPERKTRKPGCWQPRRMGRRVAAVQGVPGRVDQVKGLCLVEVSAAQDELFRTWNELIEREHPLKNCRMVGRQLRYLIGSDHGWLGALGFGSCALRLRARDEWLGWDEFQRKRYQDRLLDMRRFLIRPSVRCENLASRVLSMATTRVVEDFARCYGFEPWLLESFVNTEAYDGTCYQAANWRSLGESSGRGRNGPNAPQVARKEVYVYELNRRWREQMGIVPKSERILPLSLEESLQHEGWVEGEFGGADLGHQDATQRLLRIAQGKARNPSAAYAECVDGNRQELKAYYRFIGNKREAITPAGILSSHRRQTIRRIKGRQRVLAIQDTTDLDFSKRLHCQGLGDQGKNQTGLVSQGLKMHSTLAVSEDGLPLGIVGLHIYAAHFDGADKGQKRPIEEKESYRWLRTIEELREISELVPETELIAVGDRESDIFELFDYRRRKARNIHLLVRAQYDRCLEDEPCKLFAHLEQMPVMAEACVTVPRQREKKVKEKRLRLPARRAKVALRWDKVLLKAPETPQTQHMAAVELYAVLLTEIDPPQEAKPLRWVLLTTVPIASGKQALRCVRWYVRRWRIEEWHRVLKSGCRIEAHQHQSAAKLARAIAIDAVMAWHAMLLTLLGRVAPDMGCKLIFDPWECRLLEQLQALVAPETLPELKKKGYALPQPILSSRVWAERSTEMLASCPDLKRSCVDCTGSMISQSAFVSGKEKE